VVIVIAVGLTGSMAGAYINYFLSKWLGRPVLHTLLKKYGKFIMMSEQSLDRAEEIFREYGEVVTFISRLLPAIRQLISIPAGLSHMNLFRFTLFTALGAGLWTAFLTLLGVWFGHATGDMTYLEMIEKGKAMIQEHYLWIFAGCAVLFVGYIFVHRKIMGSKKKAPEAAEADKAEAKEA
jgi:membrane protein DedA with SNARE-associated domain